jgi:hypothetical protein
MLALIGLSSFLVSLSNFGILLNQQLRLGAYMTSHCPQIDFVDQYIGWNCCGFQVVLKWENGIDSVKVQCYYFC